MKTMEWDDKRLVQVLEEMHTLEQIPVSKRRTEIRTRLMGSYGVYLSVLETNLGSIGVAFNERGIVSLQLPRPTNAQAWRDLNAAFPEGMRRNDVPESISREL